MVVQQPSPPSMLDRNGIHLVSDWDNVAWCVVLGAEACVQSDHQASMVGKHVGNHVFCGNIVAWFSVNFSIKCVKAPRVDFGNEAVHVF